MALFTGQQAHAGRTERGSTPLICAVSRQQGDSAVAPASRSTRGGQSEVPRRLPARSHVGRGMALFTGQQAHAGVTERGSTPSICAVSRQQGDSAVAPVSRRTRGGQSEVPRRPSALSRASRGDSAVAPASRSTRGGQSEVPRRSFALSRASRGDSAVAPVSRRTRGGQSEGPRRPSALSRASEGDSVVAPVSRTLPVRLMYHPNTSSP